MPAIFLSPMRCLIIAILLYTLCTCVKSTDEVVVIDLNGTWDLANANGTVTTQANVPGQVHTDLLRQKIIADPCWGANDDLVKWVGLDDWIFTKKFEISDEILSSYAQHSLEFDGIDTIAEIVLNGHKIGESSNMFVPLKFHASQHLIVGTNTLSISIVSAAKYATHQAYPYPINSGVYNRSMIRKKQCDFGWDWGPEFITCGIWKPVRIVAFSTPIIDSVSINTVSMCEKGDECHDFEVEFVITLDIPETGADGDLIVSIDGIGNKSTPIDRHDASSMLVHVIMPVSNVKLWWPRGIGVEAAHLYNVKIQFKNEEVTRQIGCRSIEIVQDPIGDGLSFYFRVNGQAIFAKGSNMIPMDTFESRVTTDKIKHVINDLVEGENNIVRVWGGGIYQYDEFYDMCDSHGIMVWQEFQFACAEYPRNHAFVATVREEVTLQTQRLMHHPSICLWSANNEVQSGIPALTKSNGEQVFRARLDFDALYIDVIREIVTSIDVTRPFLASSPSNGVTSMDPMHLRWVSYENDHRWGDMHRYDTKHDCTNPLYFPSPRFMSEYGYQSMPWSIKDATDPSDWHWDSPMMHHRQRHDKGQEELKQSIEWHFRFPDSFDHFIYLSQTSQALCLSARTAHLRRDRYDPNVRTMGAMVWSLNSVWAAPTWSTIESTGHWKLAHYALKKLFQPFTAVISIDPKYIVDETVTAWVMSDYVDRSINGTAVVSVIEYKSGDVMWTWRVDFELGPGEGKEVLSKTVAELFIDAKALPEHCFVTIDAVTTDNITADAIWLPTSLVHADLQKCNFEISDMKQVTEDSAIFTLSTDNVAAFVEMTGSFDGHFSDNGFFAIPGRNRSVTFTADAPFSADELNVDVRSVRDTYD